MAFEYDHNLVSRTFSHFLRDKSPGNEGEYQSSETRPVHTQVRLKCTSNTIQVHLKCLV